MVPGAFLIPLAVQCAISAAVPAPPDTSRQVEPVRWLELLEAQPDHIVTLREEIVRAMEASAAAPAPIARSGQFPMRIYGCDAAGPVREFIATPSLVVIPATPGSR